MLEINTFQSKWRDYLRLVSCKCISSNTRDAQAALGVASNRHRRYDCHPSTAVVCDAQQRRQRLTCPFLDSVVHRCTSPAISSCGQLRMLICLMMMALKKAFCRLFSLYFCEGWLLRISVSIKTIISVHICTFKWDVNH